MKLNKKFIRDSINLFQSCSFIFNILTIYTIFIIMRYKTIYSMILMLGVFITPFIKKYAKISIILIPCSIIPIIFELITLYFFNIEKNIQEIDFLYKSIFSFQEVLIPLEYTLLMIYLGLGVYFIKQTLKTQRKTKMFQKNTLNPSLLIILKMIIIKYSDIFSLTILFWISLYTVNLIHSALVCFFFVYLHVKVNYIPENSNLSPKLHQNQDKKWNFYSIKLIYWKILIAYLEFIIFFK